jgi:DNA-binding transcriptional ArsR family regulator
MSSDDDSDRIFKALADRRRRAILDALKNEPKTTGQLVALFPEIDRCTADRCAQGGARTLEPFERTADQIHP